MPTATVEEIAPKSVLNRVESEHFNFRWTINPYRGCEHGCVYCYARPTHAYLDLSPGLDFETHIVAKVNAAVDGLVASGLMLAEDAPLYKNRALMQSQQANFAKLP